MTKTTRAFRLDEQTEDDILAMAGNVGKPGNYTAGFYALVAAWRRYEAAEVARQEQAAQALSRIVEHEDQRDAVAGQLAQHEEYLDALGQRAEAEGR